MSAMKTIFTTILIVLYLFLQASKINAQWSQTNIPTIGTITALTFFGSTIFAAANRGGIYYSNNNGTNWTAANAGLTNTGVWTLVISGTNLFAGTDGGGVFLSADSGTSWSEVNTGLSNKNVKTLALIGSNLFAGTDAGVFSSTNNGTSWSEVSTGLTNKNIQALFVSGTNLFAGTMGGVFLSTNNGTNWSAANNGLPNNFFRGAFVSNGKNIFAGLPGNGVFISTNSGSSWQKVNTGLTNTDVFTLFSISSNLYAGTGNGVFLSTNNGASWNKVSTGLPTNDNVLSIVSIGNSLFAGTEHFGVFKLDTVFTGVESLKETQNEIKVYPNPNTGLFKISYGTTKVQNAFVDIYNVEGKLKFSQTYCNSTSATIDLSGYPNGMYLIKVVMERVSYVERIVKE